MSAAMDILSFALYHENNKVVGEDAADDAAVLGQKRQREEPDLTDASDVDEENAAQRQRVEEGAEESARGGGGGNTLAELKAAVYSEVSRSLEDSVAVDDICTDVEDRAMVAQAINSLEEDGKIMQSEGEVYLID